MPLNDYQNKRDFKKTPEPEGAIAEGEENRFVVHEHHASRLHFDLRLEKDGVLKSWAISKGPSMNPADKRLAMMVEDHPLDYITFRGEIAEGNYGAGEVEIWDSGTYEMLEDELENGKFVANLMGVKLRGEFHFVRLKDKKDEWLLIKGKDSFSDPNWKLEQILPGGSRKERQEIKSNASDKTDSSTAIINQKKQPDPMPQVISPMLATLIEKPFSDPGWLFEIKWDGYRAISFVEKDSFRFISRRNIDLIKKFPQAETIPGLINASSAILDGEIVVVDENGKPNFQKLQNIAGFRSRSISIENNFSLIYYVFDLIYLNGRDLHDEPLIERKKLLKSIIHTNDFLKYSDEIVEFGKDLFKKASEEGLEGIIAKKLDSRYIERRTSYWLKMKTHLQQEVVIGGYTKPRSSRQYFGALVVGVYDENSLKFAGHIGTGFDDSTLKKIFDLMQPLKSDNNPFATDIKTNEPVQWVEPKLICEVKFAEWTSEGSMRQPVFLGIREDKTAIEVAQEVPVKIDVDKLNKKTKKSTTKSKQIAEPVEDVFNKEKLVGNIIVDVDGIEVSLTNMDKIYWPEEKISKGELLRYYYKIRKTILPYLKGRPQILKRFPNGIKEEPFYQHNLADSPKFLNTISINEKDNVINYAIIDDTASLLYIVNLGNIAMNTFMSRADDLKKPDWLALDLDPEETSFKTVCEVAMVVKDVLSDIGLKGYPKTSGSRGMHIFIPIDRSYTYEQTQAFARILSTVICSRIPEKATINRTMKKRTSDQVYVDFFQNAEGKSITSPYSVRECPGATVSAPLSWDEIESLPDKNSYTIFNMPNRILKLGDIYKDVLGKHQKLDKPTQRLEQLLK